MRTHLGLPSNDYTIILNKEDLEKLLNNKHISVRIGKTPCTTARAVFNNEKGQFEFLGRRETYNDLRFYLDGAVAGIDGGDCSIQFLNIILENESED